MMEFLASANYRDLQGHCRCLFWDLAHACDKPQCFLYHHGVDCPSFTATGVCGELVEDAEKKEGEKKEDKEEGEGGKEEKKQCLLVHNAEKHRYSTHHPQRPDISAQVVAVWTTVKSGWKAIPLESVFDTPEKLALWPKLLTADREMRWDAVPIREFVALCSRSPPSATSTSTATSSPPPAPSSPPLSALQNLERVYRSRNMNTWLIARKSLLFDLAEYSLEKTGHADAFEARFLQDGRNGKKCTYNILFSTRFPEHALLELLEESESYEENFNKLADCGFVVVGTKQEFQEKVASSE